MQTEKQVALSELVARYEKALADYGLSCKTRLMLLDTASRVVRVHENNGEEYLSDNLVTNYASGITERYSSGIMNRGSYQHRMRELARFINFANNGDVVMPCPSKGSRIEISLAFSEIAEEFVATIPHCNTRNDARWVAHKYFLWLEEHDCESVAGTGADDIQKFMLDCSRKMSLNSMHNVKLYIKKLYAFLYASGRAESDYAGLLSFKANRETGIYPMLPRDDIPKLLDSINRTTKVGKRNYAIMLLGVVLGLRACDIVALKKTDIDWQKGEIKIAQAKTGNTVVLPLTEDVGEALSDYLLNARPDVTESRIFLRIWAPHRALSSAVTLGEIYEGCCKKAGLPVTKRFHNLRRSLATAMVTNGVSVYDVAQGLGDKRVDSVTPYIGLDTVHLKICALSFDGIAPVGKRAAGGERI